MARPLKPRTPLGERLIAVREALGFKKRDGFAERLGVPADTLGTYERGVAAPSPDLLATYHREFGVNVNWLVSGVGDMLDFPAEAPLPPISVEPATVQHLVDTMGRMSQDIGGIRRSMEPPPPPPTTITFIPLQASAGGGSVVYEEPEEIQMDMDMLSAELLEIAPKHIRLFRIRGESMYPTLHNNDVVVVDRSKPGRGKYPEGDKLYVVSVAGELFAKRAEWLSGNVLSWISDNPRFEPVVVGPDEVNTIKVIGQVVWMWHKVK